MSPISVPPGARPAVVLHVGMGKTGTSSLQALFHRNRERLAEHGILYPVAPGPRRHVRLGLAMQAEGRPPRTSFDWRRQDVSTPEELRPVLEAALVEEVEAAGLPRMLLSDEALFTLGDSGLSRLGDLLSRIGKTTRVVVYLRRQDDHLCSRYQQTVKRGGEVDRLADRIQQLDDPRKYDYQLRLERWRSLVGPEDLIVRVFERERFSQGSLYHDFLEATGFDVSYEELDAAPTSNESLDAEALEFLRILNLYRREHSDHVPGLIRQNRLERRLVRHSTGPTLTLPPDRLDRFMAQWEESNRAVARTYLLDGLGELFERPRKTRHTTTEQLLDPARLDTYLELAEIAPEVHAPLRRIAEREAAAR